MDLLAYVLDQTGVLFFDGLANLGKFGLHLFEIKLGHLVSELYVLEDLLLA